MRFVRPFLAVLAAAVALLTAAVPAAAQGTDLLRGRVTDAEGAPLGGVRIEATSAESGVTRSTATNADGRYTIAFPDGGGRYTIRASTVGRQAQSRTVARQADEEVLIADFRLTEQAVMLEAISVEAERGPQPTRGDVGGQERNLSGEIVNRLPLENTDAASLAALSPGVVALSGDSASGRGAFSVGGQQASQNQVTLDGASFSSRLSGGESGGSPIGVPQEGVRGTQVVTSTFDVSRGQFAGGLVATTTRSGTNRPGGSFSWQLRDQALQLDGGNPQLGQGYTQNRFSGGFGGPIVKDRLFYFLSFTYQHRTDDLYALTPQDPLALQRFGVTPQAVDTFLTTLTQTYGLTGRTGDYARTGDALSFLGRTDVVINQQHNLALRAHLNMYDQENARIGFLETLENGGEVGSDGGGAIATLTSRFSDGWVNELRASVNIDRRDQTPYEELPEGRVQVASALEGAGRGFSSFAFGGDRSLPSLSRERTFEVADELSMLVRDTHRLKAGLVFNANTFEQQQSSNRLGTFEFESLEAFAEGRPFRFTRQLSDRVTEGSGIDVAAYLGDTWRPRTEVQVTGGVRVEGSRFGEDPALNPRIQEQFGYRTDNIPGEIHVSPRVGFSWRLSEQGAPLRLVRGGLGEFRGRAPYSLFAAALEQTGLPGGETQIDCVGSATPIADWQRFLDDPSTIPTECVGGGVGQPVRSVPSVTVFEDDFSAPRSWRASLGYQTQLLRRVSANFDFSYTLGVAQTGVRDLNRRETPAFTIDEEGGRPVYAQASAIQPSSAAIPLYASRVDPELGYVFAVNSALENRTAQATVGLQGIFGPRLLLSANYTWSRSTDQGSFAGGSPLGGLSQAVTRGDPNVRDWATSDRERRHTLVATMGMPIGQSFEFSLIARANSGSPFTPVVGQDINGDGVRNDAAFVFDPSAVAGDTALASGMQRLLGSVPGRVGDCLRDQMGEVAERNSCRGEWSTNFDLRATFRPELPNLGRRLSIMVDAFNLAAGLDEILHGS
ncbi:TonB-dependent receptor, partial [Longimicrobium sp.]|uniref:TonB-dependent receptor n=1 Tax=Longimicrobium sp. TaxID=2029185 RepID=UPI002E335F26